MIKRVSMWRLNDKDEASKMKDALMSMKGKVASLKDVEVGINIAAHDSAFDIVFIATFEDDNALVEFESDPLHKMVGELVGELKNKRVFVDYEF